MEAPRQVRNQTVMSQFNALVTGEAVGAEGRKLLRDAGAVWTVAP